MATLFVDKVDPQSGTSLEIGSSGDTVTIPSGCTLTNSGTATGFGGITMADQWRLTTAFTGNAEPISSNLERNDTAFDKIGTGMSESSGVFSFPSTGIYLVELNVVARAVSAGDIRYAGGQIDVTTDNSSYNK